MLDQNLRLDIRIVKFQDYIRRKPTHPFGYYGLGVQYMLSGKPAHADRLFMQALKIEPDYAPARLGKIEFLLLEKKFLSAARYYQKYQDCFKQKKIHMSRIQRVTSQLYLSRGFYRQTKKIHSLFVFKEGFGALQRMFNNGPDNPVVNLLLAIYFLKESKEGDRARTLYNLCVGMNSIADKFRWDLIHILSKEQAGILKDGQIADMFSSIPEGAFGKDYASFLLSRFILQEDREKVLKAFSEFQKKHIQPDKKTMWEYLFFCRKRDIWNHTLAFCCQKLIASGWVDRFLASMVKELKARGLLENAHELDKILSLYGYTGESSS